MKRAFVILSILAIFFHSGFVGAAESPRQGGRLVFGARNDLTNLNPFIRTTSSNFYIRDLAYESLVDFDKNGKRVPRLAQSWTVSTDGKTYTFRLRPGVRFHDGQELTAEDVKWSVEYALDPKNGATGFVPLKDVETVNVKDKLTLEIVLKRPEATFLDTLSTIRPFPIVPKQSVPGGGGKVLSAPPGTGPFVLKEYRAARDILFVRHKNYWQKNLPYLDEIVLKPVPDEQVRFTSLRAGDLDMIERTPYAFVAKVLKGEFPQLKTSVAKYAGYRRLLFNVASPPFNNLKLRQAVLYALDKRRFIQGAFWGLGEPTDQLMPKDSQWHVPLPEIKRDPARVKALLKEAGVSPDLEIELMGLKSEEEELQVLHEQLVSAGIKAKLTIVESAARRSREGSGDFMMSLSGSDVPSNPGLEYPNEFACNEEEVRTKKRGENASGYCNKEFDRLVEEAGKITDEKRRLELYNKATRIIFQDTPDIPLALVPRYFTYHEKIRGFETDNDGRLNMTTGGLSRTWLAK